MNCKCPCETEAITLQNMLSIALGNAEKLTPTNIAILYSVVKSILKKLNCEDEVVIVSGVKSKELQNLLCEANRCPLPCDAKLEVLTKHLDKLEALEQQVEMMEAKLNKHLEPKFKETVYEKTNLDEEHSEHSHDPQPILQLHKASSRAHALHRNTTISFSQVNYENDMKIKTRSLVFEVIKAAPSRFAFSPAPSSLATDATDATDVESIIANADCLAEQTKELKETFSAFKRRVEDNENWWEFPNVCEEASAEISAKRSETDHVKIVAEVEVEEKAEEAEAEATSTETSNPTNDVYCCYVPCEDVFTIPAPEFELPRALLKSTFFMQTLREFLRAPFMRRIKKIEDNIETLFVNFLDWIMRIKEYSTESSFEYENALSQLADVSYNITSNYLMLQDTCAGMQEIFDLKVNKVDIIPIKEELCDLFNSTAEATMQVKDQLKQSRTSAFVYQTEAEKSLSAALAKPTANLVSCAPCKSHVCEPHTHESRLLKRIEQISSDELTLLKERQQASYRPIRLTNSSNVLRDVTKQLHSIYRIARKSLDP